MRIRFGYLVWPPSRREDWWIYQAHLPSNEGALAYSGMYSTSGRGSLSLVVVEPELFRLGCCCCFCFKCFFFSITAMRTTAIMRMNSTTGVTISTAIGIGCSLLGEVGVGEGVVVMIVPARVHVSIVVM